MDNREPEYLVRLNDRQKEAVLATEGPVSVLAGAGSGKTSVLTTRIYHLIRKGVAAEQILAVTFTNKAAREMRERLNHRLGATPGRDQRPGAYGLPFIATFHGLGRELLETYGEVMGIPRRFCIFDRDDSKSAIREALKALDIDPKEVPPAAILSRISKAKGEGMSLPEFRERHGRESFRSRITAEAWIRYEDTLKKEKALDFDDLIVLPVRLLEKHDDVRAQVQDRFQYLHVDEFQDTNELQGKLVNLIAGDRKNVFVVGDIDQCLLEDTPVSMADGTVKPIQDIQKGDFVLSNYGTGDIRSARVTAAFSNEYTGALVRFVTKGGRTLTSTPEHMHFAGYRLGITPQMYFTYLMHKEGYGWRLGVSQTYTLGQRLKCMGYQQRCNQEHGDHLWIVGTAATSQEARVCEYRLSLTYGIPTLPFVARKTKGSGGYVHDQAVLDGIFASLDTTAAAERLLEDLGLSLRHPHHRAKATRSRRRNIMLTLCGEHRGRSPMHRVSLVGCDEAGRQTLIDAGYSVRVAKSGTNHWRFETASASYDTMQRTAEALTRLFPEARIVETARLGKTSKIKGRNALPLIPAASVLPGMAVFDEHGEWDLIAQVERIEANKVKVYDLNIERTHNFIGNGLVTHNSIYTWRGATIDNLLKFEETYPDAAHVVLEHNYRSTKTIVRAANEIIEKNQNRKEKRSVTDNPTGDRIVIQIADNAEREARWIAGQIRKAMQDGTGAEDIAVLYRTNFQSRGLEEALLHAGIPYRLLGTRFFDRKEVKDTLAWIRLALDPAREIDRVRAVQSPPRGIGKVTLGKIAAGRTAELRPAERAKVAAFENLMHSLGELAESMTPSAFVKLVAEKSGLESALLKEGEDGQERLENVMELATLASRHDESSGKDGIASFLAEAALASDQDEMDRDEKKKGVTLMTVHAAKGLEFDHVFVTGLEEGLFPHEGVGDEERDEEEERRLFYVAVTRAKKRLVLTLARVRRIYGTDYLSEPSSFLRDIDPSLTVLGGTEDRYEDVIYI